MNSRRIACRRRWRKLRNFIELKKFFILDSGLTRKFPVSRKNRWFGGERYASLPLRERRSKPGFWQRPCVTPEIHSQRLAKLLHPSDKVEFSRCNPVMGWRSMASTRSQWQVLLIAKRIRHSTAGMEKPNRVTARKPRQ
ncbi:hypothetical protein MiSe_04990 [Microseira wollei NIES-4236]|uniref:Transposase n=1 Tax=Microseira wollei NIES-4236 TaxID=2530354 RepID=A0AAV3WEM1_9CYAN|nr:hypothetical protein MiSe_04990 [Microseira wollei NIES-4236]